MPHRLSCPQGHQWEYPDNAPSGKAKSPAVCPICGATEVKIVRPATPAPKKGAAPKAPPPPVQEGGTEVLNGRPPGESPPPAPQTEMLEATIVPPSLEQTEVIAASQNPERARPAFGLSPAPKKKREDNTRPEVVNSTDQTLLPPPLTIPAVDPGSETVAPSNSVPPPAPEAETLVPTEPMAPHRPAAPLAPADQVSVPGYEILGVLGRGGMGIVYKARQVKLNRIVALKMTLSGAHADPQELARFRIEGEAVARLQHPYIVQIYEVGEQNGRPYFSLEYLEGGSLDKKLQGTPLPPRESAELLEKLARAMSAAHQHGIIHRDLKPANILLAADGSPKITDFGLAKRLEEDVGQTRTGAIMGTPSYMAPEQASGNLKEIGTPADVYSLGAILYDLLTGRPPFRGTTVLETLNQVQSAEPVRPSRLQPKVPGDLETICLKCLQKESPKRYASALDLAEDLRRFQAGEPILARPTPPWERALKWARRRPAAAAVVALCLILVFASVAGALFYLQNKASLALQREEDQRQRTKEQSQRADEEARLKGVALANFQQAHKNFEMAREAVDQMLTQVGQERLANVPEMEDVRRDLLAKAVDLYERFAQADSTDPGIRFDSGRAYVRVGDIQKLLGSYGEADKAYRSGQKLLEDLSSEFPDQPGYRADLAACLNNRANLFERTGHPAEARDTYQQALRLWQSLADEVSAQPDYRLKLADTFNNLASLGQDVNPLEARDAYQKAIDLQAKLVQDVPDNLAYKEKLARTYNNLGIVVAATGPVEDAEKDFLTARDLLQELRDKHPNVPDYQRDLAISYRNLGNLWRGRNPTKARQAFEEALKLEQELAVKFPKISLYQQDLAGTCNDLGILLLDDGWSPDADKDLHQSLEIKKKLAAENPSVPEYQFELAKGYNNLGLLQESHEQLDDAQRQFDEALKLFDPLCKGFPPEDRPAYWHETARTHLNRGILLQALGRFHDAEEAYLKALDLRTQKLAKFQDRPEYRHELGRTYLNLAVVLEKQGKVPEAEKDYRQAVELFTGLEKTFPETLDYRYERAVTDLNLAHLLRTASRPAAEVEKPLGEALPLLEKLKAECPTRPGYRQELARTQNEFGILWGEGDRIDQAEKPFEKALDLQQKLGQEFPDRPAYQAEWARTCNNLGILQVKLNRGAQAEASDRQAIALLEKLQAQAPPVYWREDLIDGYTNLANLLVREGPQQEAEAETDWKHAIALQEDQVAASPEVPAYRSALVQNMKDLAGLLKRRHKDAAANRLLEEALHYQQAGSRQDSLTQIDILLLLKDHARAAQAVTDLLAASPPDGPQAYRLAGVLAGCTALALQDAAYSESRRQELAQGYGDRAMKLLRQAAAGGYKDVASLRQAPNFEGLRSRKDFQNLLAELEMSSKGGSR